MWWQCQRERYNFTKQNTNHGKENCLCVACTYDWHSGRIINPIETCVSHIIDRINDSVVSVYSWLKPHVQYLWGKHNESALFSRLRTQGSVGFASYTNTCINTHTRTHAFMHALSHKIMHKCIPHLTPSVWVSKWNDGEYDEWKRHSLAKHCACLKV